MEETSGRASTWPELEGLPADESVKWQRAERTLAVQYAVSRILNEALSLQEASPHILRAVGEGLGWDAGAVWLPEPDRDELHCLEFWQTSEAQAQALEQSSRATILRRGFGLPGRVWESGSAATIAETPQDESFPRAAAAASAGLRGAFAFPIYAGGGTLAIFEFFSRKAQTLDHHLLTLLSAIGGQIGQFTERRRSEESLRETAARYRLLFESNPHPMWVYDRETLAFLAVNNAAIEQYGYSREEFSRMSLKDIRPADDIPALLDDVHKSTSRLHRDGPWRHRKKDGTVIAVEITAHPIQFDSRDACLVLSSDITERIKIEEQFHQSQRLESIGRLAGGVAHDFNNLLTVINGYTELILSRLPRESQFVEALGEIRGAGQRAASLTGQLLAFSRKQIVQPAVLNLNHVVTEVEKMLRRLIGEDIELATKLASGLGNIRADAGQMQQVIMNLAVNARDAMPGGGTLIIETTNVALDQNYSERHPDVQPGPYVMLAVTDTGAGMTEEVRQRIFEPFFTTKPKGSGTGLGLATVHGMVRQSGGWIWVYSEVGRGTTFKIYFPQVADSVTPGRAVVRTDLRGDETILVVEDQEEVRKLAEAALKQHGYTVLSAKSGEEAISLAGTFSGAIHLLLTDIVMPGMNGRDLAARLTKDRQLRVLFMSGYTDNAIAHRGILDSGVDYIQKPFTPRTLAQKVREVLGTRQSAATVLLVDDDDSARKLLRNMLTAAGFAVIEAGDGKRALEQAAQYPNLDLVITDLVMPEREGLETIRMLRKHHPKVGVIAISGAFGGEMLAIAKAMGASATLPKPITADELLRAVHQVSGK